MASAQCAGTYRFYMIGRNGDKHLVFACSNYFAGPGGSPDGVIANTPEKWNWLPLSSMTGGAGSKFMLTIQGTGATMDASDAIYQIPVIVNGAGQILGNPAATTGLMSDAFTSELTPSDIAFATSVETPVFIARANEGTKWKLGGNRMFVSIENNA